MFMIVCVLAGLGVALGTECETELGGECHTRTEGCPSHLPLVSYNYCGFQHHCCYNEPDSTDHPLTTPSSGESCGISAVNDNHRIVGGTLASDGEYPWQVSLMLRGSHMCGGTLIDSQHVLTAAHCFDSNDPTIWTVGFGTVDRYAMKGGSHVRSVDRIHIHEDYDEDTIYNDIAIMKLASPVDLSGTDVRAACLPYAGERFHSHTCTVVGWGLLREDGHVVRYLREVDLPIVSISLCNYYLGSGTGVIGTQMCAGVLEGGKDACQADSGGPLLCHKNGVWKVAGVVSWGYGCADKETPGVYTRVSKFLDWIHNAISQ